MEMKVIRYILSNKKLSGWKGTKFDNCTLLDMIKMFMAMSEVELQDVLISLDENVSNQNDSLAYMALNKIYSEEELDNMKQNDFNVLAKEYWRKCSKETFQEILFLAEVEDSECFIDTQELIDSAIFIMGNEKLIKKLIKKDNKSDFGKLLNKSILKEYLE